MDEKELKRDFDEQGYSDNEISCMLGFKTYPELEGIEGLPKGCMPDEGKPYPNEHA